MSGFGELLRSYRVTAGYSQDYLAEVAGISVEAVGALERGTRRAPHRATVALLAKALDLDDEGCAELEAAARRARSRGARSASAAAARQPNIPLQSTSFIGRMQEVATIFALIDRARLVTVTGSGGVGKTRVALEVVARLSARNRDFRVIELSALADATFLVDTIAASLHQARAQPAKSIQELVRAIGSSGVLLVLDNCEHLIDEAARVVSALLQSCEAVRFLTTSRERLGIGGEAVYRLPSLPVPTDRPTSLEQARRYAGVELFIDRASAAGSVIAATDAAESIVEICRRLEGIPLAIELTAARYATLAPELLLRGLSDGLAVDSGDRDMPVRQRTMRATIEWSYNLLNELEKSLLARISLFAGGFTLAAAEAVCSIGEIEMESVADLLSSLVHKSLVNVSLSGTGARYALLESVRAFARERLTDAGELELVSQRHAEWVAAFADWVEEARVALAERRLRTDVDPELDNARAALAWTLATRSAEHALLAGRIIGGLRTIWLTSGRRDECTRWAQAAIDLIDEERHPHIVARMLRALFQAATGTAAIATAQRAIPVFERIGDWLGLALLHSNVAYHYRVRFRYAEADAAMELAEGIIASLDAPRSMHFAAYLWHRFYSHLDHGRYDQALGDIAEGAAIVKGFGDEEALSWQILRSEAEFAMGRCDAAIATSEDVISRAQKHPARYERELLWGRSNLAVYRLANGDVDGGYAAARDALRYAHFDGINEGFCNAVGAMAFVAARREEPRSAARLGGAVDAFFDRPNDVPALACRGRTPDLAIREMLLAALARQLSDREIADLRSEGARYPLDIAIAEALEI